MLNGPLENVQSDGLFIVLLKIYRQNHFLKNKKIGILNNGRSCFMGIYNLPLILNFIGCFRGA